MDRRLRKTRATVSGGRKRPRPTRPLKSSPTKKATVRKPRVYVWKDELLLGVEEIDLQHKRWFNLTNAFLERVRNKKADIETVRKFLAQAVGHSDRHFRAEEAFMRRLKLPCDIYHAHITSHDNFVERINALAENCRRGSPTAVQQMVAFMTGWLTRHIKKYDVAYLKYYKE